MKKSDQAHNGTRLQQRLLKGHGLMDIAVIGPGAMGMLFAAMLSRAGHRVTLVDHRPDRARRLSEHGILVEDPDGEGSFSARPKAAEWSEVCWPFDVVLILVKAHHTSDVAARFREAGGRIIREGGLVVSLQNGVGQHEILVSAGIGPVALGSAMLGVSRVAETMVRVAGLGTIYLGIPSDAPEARDGSALNGLERFSCALEEAGFKTEISSDIYEVLWKKLFVNVGINAVTALCGMTNGSILAYEEAETLMEDAVTEAHQVYMASGRSSQKLDQVIREVRQVCRLTSRNLSSMLQDRKTGRATEIDFINGAVCKMGSGCGVETPVNRTLWSLVRVCQKRGWAID